MMPCSGVFHGTKGEIAARKNQNDDSKDFLFWKEIKCPHCNSTNVEIEVEIPVRFCISHTGHVQINSDVQELTHLIDSELGEYNGLSCKCLDCGWNWYLWDD